MNTLNLRNLEDAWIQDLLMVVDKDNPLWIGSRVAIIENGDVVFGSETLGDSVVIGKAQEGLSVEQYMNRAIYDDREFYRNLALANLNKNRGGTYGYKYMPIEIYFTDTHVVLSVKGLSDVNEFSYHANEVTFEMLEEVYGYSTDVTVPVHVAYDHYKDIIETIKQDIDKGKRNYGNKSFRVVTPDKILWKKKDSEMVLIDLSPNLIGVYLEEYPQYKEFMGELTATEYHASKNNIVKDSYAIAVLNN